MIDCITSDNQSINQPINILYDRYYSAAPPLFPLGELR